MWLLQRKYAQRICTNAWSFKICSVRQEFSRFGQNFRFVLGGLSRCFNCSIPRVRFASYHPTRETLKRARLCILLSPQLSLSHPHQSKSCSFRFVQYTALACDAHGARDLLGQLSLDKTFFVWTKLSFCCCPPKQNASFVQRERKKVLKDFKRLYEKDFMNTIWW